MRIVAGQSVAAVLSGALVALSGSSASMAAVHEGAASGEGEFIVGFERGVSRGEQANMVERQGAGTVDALRGRALVITATVKEAGRLSREPEVRYVERNGTVKATGPLLPTDPQLDDLWGIKRVGAPDGWRMMSRSSEVVVAVSDTGIWAAHEDLRPRLWENTDEIPGDGVDNDSNGVIDDTHGANLSNGGQSGETDDRYGHGTHVAGTIGAEAYNGLGVVGVAPNVRLMNSRFLDDNGYGQIGDAARSIDYAVENGARVINCSWGTTDYSHTIRDAIVRARARNVLIVAAAGNSTQDADLQPMFPAAYEDSNVISVAATTSADKLASFSNYGRVSVDLGAPGQTIRSTIVNGGSGYNSGTSMAAPHVSGIAAVLWGERPELGYWDIRRAILEGGSPLAALEEKTVTGRLASLSGSLDYLDGLKPEDPPAEPTTPQDPPPATPPPEANPDPNPDRRPALVQAPLIRGSSMAPGNLYCDGGWWSGSNDVHIRWVRGDEVIGYGPGYTTGDRDLGTSITCRAIAFNAFGSTTADSAAIKITGPSPTPLIRHSTTLISRQGGKAFRCEPGDWSGVERFDYSWVLRGKEISQAQTLRFKKKWRGLRVSCVVVAHGQGGVSEESRSRPRKLSWHRK